MYDTCLVRKEKEKEDDDDDVVVRPPVTRFFSEKWPDLWNSLFFDRCKKSSLSLIFFLIPSSLFLASPRDPKTWLSGVKKYPGHNILFVKKSRRFLQNWMNNEWPNISKMSDACLFDLGEVWIDRSETGKETGRLRLRTGMATCLANSRAFIRERQQVVANSVQNRETHADDKQNRRRSRLNAKHENMSCKIC